ncbi:uncharacterized protein LOC110357667 [Columba livia]|uniref:uncharacterized protein LOC110357667 n=1 Tax=Columba livia TaxID=8932 RepID=UPI0031B9F4FD
MQPGQEGLEDSRVVMEDGSLGVGISCLLLGIGVPLQSPSSWLCLLTPSQPSRPWCCGPGATLPASLMLRWLLAGLSGVLRAASPPLRGSPGPPRGALAAPAGSGGPGHSLLAVLLQLFSLPVGWMGSVAGAAGTPPKSWAGGRRLPVGGSRARSRIRAALPRPSSRGVLQAQPTSDLPAAQAHDGVDELLDKAPRAPAQGGLQHPDQRVFDEAEAAQAGHDESLCCCCLLGILQELPQLLAQPGQQGLEDSGVDAEDGRPGRGMEAAHGSPGQRPRSRWPGCCRLMEAVGGWVSGSPCCHADDDRSYTWRDDPLLIVVVRPHRVQDGGHPPLAEGALGLGLSPPHDARVAELVQAWQDVAGLLPAVQADWTAGVQLRGHALHVRRWAVGSWGCHAAPSRWRCSSGCHAKKGREATVHRWSGQGWEQRPGPSRRRASWLPRVSFPLSAHLCCCERSAWVSRLPERARAGQKPPMALGSRTESCTEELPELDLSTRNRLAEHSNLASSLSWRAGKNRRGQAWRPDTSSKACVVTMHLLVMSPSIAQGHHRPSPGKVTTGHCLPVLKCICGVTARPLFIPCAISCLQLSNRVSLRSPTPRPCLPRVPSGHYGHG